MADDRPAESEIEAIATLRTELADLRSTMLVRVDRKPTGDTEFTIRNVPKADTLFLNGATVNRADYPNLWQWAQDQGLVIAGMFGAGNGTTTFVLPDYRGRFPVIAGTLGSDTYTLGQVGGASTRTLTTNELPSHTHTGSGSTGSYSHSHGSAGGHSHSGGSSSGGNHGGHNSGSFGVQAGGDGATSGNSQTGGGDHSHSMSINSSGDHSHSGDNHSHSVTVNVNSTGSGAPFDARPAWKTWNVAIWT